MRRDVLTLKDAWVSNHCICIKKKSAMKSPDRWFFTEREASDVCAKESAQQVRNRIGHTDKSADFVLCIYSPRAVITIWAPSLAWWYANCSPAVRIGTRQRHPGTSVGLWGREEAVSSQHVAACGQEENMSDRHHSRADIRRTDAHQLCCQDRSCTSKQIVLGVKWLHIPKQGRLWHRLVDGKYGLERCREKGRLLSLVYLLWGGESCRWSVKAASSSAHFCKDYKIINKDSEHVHLKPESSLLRKKRHRDDSEMICFCSSDFIGL